MTDERQTRAKHRVWFVKSDSIRDLCPREGTLDGKTGAARELADRQPKLHAPRDGLRWVAAYGEEERTVAMDTLPECVGSPYWRRMSVASAALRGTTETDYRLSPAVLGGIRNKAFIHLNASIQGMFSVPTRSTVRRSSFWYSDRHSGCLDI